MSIKLFTEEQAKYFFECGRNYQNNAEITFRVAKEEIPTPVIELPSDEELDNIVQTIYSFNSIDTNDAYNVVITSAERAGFKDAIKWMRDKIQGGNK
jgi:hypothetical protein